jgi:hypothetical protein
LESSITEAASLDRYAGGETMKRVYLLLIVVLIGSAVGFSQETDISGAWVLAKLHWQPAPAKVDRHLKSSQTEVLYFAKDTRFSLLDCTIYQRDASLTVSKGDAQGIYLGSWHLSGSDIVVKYQLAYRTIEILGKQSKEEGHNVVLKLLNKQTLVFQGKTFRKEPRLDVSVEDDLRGIHSPEGAR